MRSGRGGIEPPALAVSPSRGLQVCRGVACPHGRRHPESNLQIWINVVPTQGVEPHRDTNPNQPVK